LYDVIILGGGASGLFLADFLTSKKCLIIEHNRKLGAKIEISGGGKCNITNRFVSHNNYHPSSEFVKNALKKADNKTLLDWLEKKNLKPRLLKNNKYFFNSSKELLKVLKPECEYLLNTEVIDVIEGFEVITDKGSFKSKNVVVALGGKSFKKLGASQKGYEIAEKFSHKINTPKPALVGFTVQKEQFWFKRLSGVGFLSEVEIGNKKFRDNILFSHKGITGPAVLNASLYWEKGNVIIDFLPGRKVESLLKNPHRQIISQIPLPKNFVKEFLQSIGIRDKKVKDLSKPEIEKIKILNRYPFAPAGTFGFEKAEVSKGGVDVNEIDEYMQSKKVKGLYFIGEVLDVTGELGGYNFQWAFTSAFCASINL